MTLDQLDTESLKLDLTEVLTDMSNRFEPRRGDIFVVGCSTSEVQGKRIGKYGSTPVAEVLFGVFVEFANKYDLRLAFQCCEHLNRALVVTAQTAKEEHLVEVCAVPHPTAGGSMGAWAFRHLPNSCLVESLKQQAGYGIDIGQTMVGMHMRPVVVPMRLEHKSVGKAVVGCAFSRPPLIGGERSQYSL